jgi:hypothetical protein
MGNWDVSKPDNDGERELLDRAVKALEAELATKTCNKQIVSKLEDAELARDPEETCNNKQVISKLVASSGITDEQAILHLQSTGWMQNHDREIYESGLREKLADDSGSYDSLIHCEDAISRKEALYLIGDYDLSMGQVVKGIHALPSVTPKSKTGHWIVLSPTDMYCSECHEIEHLDTSRRFCAYCGTRMSENPTDSESEEQT